MNTLNTLAAAALALVTLPAFAQDKLPLREVEEISQPMLYVAIAIEISDTCPTITARKIKGLNYLWSLKGIATDMGYTDDEIRAYVDSTDEKDLIREEGFAYARTQGVDPETTEGLCALGELEIANGSIIGGLLRAK